MEPRENDPSADVPDPASADAPPEHAPMQPPVYLELPSAEEVEMGGEAPCQLPRFWDVEE